MELINTKNIEYLDHIKIRIFSPPQNNYATHLFSGSGGQYTPYFSTTFSGETKAPSTTPETNQKILEIINYITQCFSLTKNDLKTVCDINSRKTIYNWIAGTNKPRASTMKRLFNLYIISKNWRQSGFTQNRDLLIQPIMNNQSIIDMLEKDELDKEKIMFAGARLALNNPIISNSLKDPFENDI